MYSPADIAVVLPDGVRIDNSMSNEEFIEQGLLYVSQGPEGHKALMIPDTVEGDYTIEVTGTGEGEYTLRTTYIDPDIQIQSEQEGDISLDQSEEYIFSIEKDAEGNISEESIALKQKNNPPVAVLEQSEYNGVERDEITFDASDSYDPDEDEIQYKWEIEGLYSGDWTDEAVLSYTFTDSYQGLVRLTVTDGEFDDKMEAEVTIRALTYPERVDYIRSLIESIEEDTTFIQRRKRVWLHLVDLLNHPLIERLPNLKIVISQTFERDIKTSLYLNERSQSHWLWFRRKTLISEGNEEKVLNILAEIQKL